MENKKDEISFGDNLTKNDLLELVKKQKEIIKSLQKEERNYRELFESSVDGIYKSTPEGKFIDVNIALVNMLGYDSKEELLGIDIKTDLYFDIKDRELEQPDENQEKNAKLMLRKKDGSPVWVADSGKVITDSKGNVLYHEGILRDVSEGQRASQIQKVLLKISQEGYKIHNLSEFIEFIMNELGQLIDTSNFYVAFYNEEKQTINIPFISGEVADTEFPVGKSMTGYLIKKNRPFFLKSKGYKKLIDSGETELKGKFPAVWLGVPLRVEGKVIGAIVVQNYDDEKAYQQSDIELLEFVSSHISLAVQRKKIEQEIAISKQLLRNVLDNIPIKVFWKNKELEYLGCNAAFLKAINYDSESKVIGKTDFDITKRKIAQKYRESDLEIMLSGKPKLKYQESFITKGKKSWITTSKLPFFDENKEVIGVIGTSEDITKRKEIEIKLKSQAKELELQNATKDKFFSIISHDLINPLSGVIGFSELLKVDLKAKELDRIDLYANIIHKSATFTLDLLQNLLEWSRIQVGSLISSKINFDLSKLLKSNIDGLEAQALAKNINIKCEFDDNLFVHADDKMISTIVRNLLSNAIKFTPKGGSITVISEEKIINDKKVIETAIKDTGVGISEENVNKLFKIEQNYQSRGTDNEVGTGLGLILCNEFLTQNNGTIRVESQPNVGSSFIFTLDCSIQST